MSYSRWSHSVWYTYSTVERVDDEPTLAVFSMHGHVHDANHWPISDLRESKQSILQEYRDVRFNRHNPAAHPGPWDRYSEEEINELSRIIDDFLADYAEVQTPSM